MREALTKRGILFEERQRTSRAQGRAYAQFFPDRERFGRRWSRSWPIINVIPFDPDSRHLIDGQWTPVGCAYIMGVGEFRREEPFLEALDEMVLEHPPC